MLRFVTIIAAALLVAASSIAALGLDVPKEKQTKLGKYLTAKEAYEVVQAEPGRVLFVDIRTRGELQFVGYASQIDGHVPLVEMSAFGDWDEKGSRFKLEPNPVFSTSVESLLATKGLTKADKINPYELKDMKAATAVAAGKHPAAYPVMLATSSETGAGISELRAQMAMILEERGRAVR